MITGETKIKSDIRAAIDQAYEGDTIYMVGAAKAVRITWQNRNGWFWIRYYGWHKRTRNAYTEDQLIAIIRYYMRKGLQLTDAEGYWTYWS